MFRYSSLSAVVFVIALCYTQAIEDEPTFSKMLETMVRMEAKMDKWNKEKKTFEENVLDKLEHCREGKIADPIIGTPKIAFNAYTLSSGNYGHNQPLIFPNVLLNMGGGYDKSTGIFTAPATGLYLFSAHVCHIPASYMAIAITYEDVVIAKTTEYENERDSCSSVSAPAMVQKGGKVYIKSTFFANKLKADTEWRWPSFTGVLLHV